MKYIHTNIIARDWRKLADFYIKVFGCKEVYTKRNLKGKWIDKGTGIDNVHIEGVHLKLPGYGDDGPTLEIFQYNNSVPQELKRINQEGLGHIAFRVEDVQKTLNEVIKAGGGKLSNIINQYIPKIGEITFVYVKDPEGNFIELQKYK
jgi:predicted enzyme related to lactoylglutathione lyase